MVNLERSILNRERFAFSTLVAVPGLPLVFDAFTGSWGNNNRLALYPTLGVDYEDLRFQNSFSVRGGILADEMGLGKTMSIISLILASPREANAFGEFPRSTMKQEKYPCFVSKATLVICPSQLVDQWKKEITTHSSLTCCSVSTILQHKKLTYQSLMDHDVVLVSEKFLSSNKSYKSLVQQRFAKQDIDYADNEGLELSHPSPVLNEIDWHRIVLDEGHEILQKVKMANLVSSFRWYVSGTPLPLESESLSLVYLFLNFEVERVKDTRVARLIESHFFRKHLYRRNTKAGVKKEVDIPPVEERVMCVSLTPIEQTIYDAEAFESDTRLRGVISDPKSFCSSFGSLEDPLLPNKILRSYRKRLAEKVTSLKASRVQLHSLKEQLNGTIPLALGYRYHSLKSVEHEVDKVEKDIQDSENFILVKYCQIACFCRLMMGDKGNDVCDACYQYASGRLALSCSHHLCLGCFSKAGSLSFACPVCSKRMDLSSASFPEAIHDEEIAKTYSVDMNEDPRCTAIRQHFGSKFAATTMYLEELLRTQPEAKMIVFSQYDTVLQTVSSELEKLDPETFKNCTAACKGSVHSRNKQLARFQSNKKGSARILLLSLKNSASGTHLAAATHVLLLDPVVGGAGEARATDAQAIARAHRLGQDKQVTAVRFIVTNTIDQDDYEKSYGKLLTHRGARPKSARSAFPGRDDL